MRVWIYLAVVLASFGTSSCLFQLEHLRFAGQEVQLRYDAKSDSADLLLVYDGLMSVGTAETHVADAERHVQQMLAHRRYFVIGDWPLEMDLDANAADDTLNPVVQLEKLDPKPDSADARMIEFLRGISVVDAKTFADKFGRLSLYQRFRLPKFSRFIAALHGELAEMMLAPTASRGEGDTFFDEPTWKAWIDRAKRGDSWIKFDGPRLDVDLLASPRAIAVLVSSIAADDKRVFSHVLDSLAEVEPRSNGIKLRWIADEHGRWKFTLGRPGEGTHDLEDSALENHMRSNGLDLKQAPTVAQVRELLAN